MAITKGNRGSVTLDGQTACEIANWSATINTDQETIDTMCADASTNPVILESDRFVEFSFESYVFFGDVVSGNVSLVNDVLTVSGPATIESIDINTPADGIVTFSYNGRVNDYTITTA